MLRRSFRLPITEFGHAADLLAEGADALIAGNNSLCEQRLREADLQSLRDFAFSICGPINPAIHRQRANPIYSPQSGDSARRMPSAALTRRVFSRDGCRCRFCESRVIVRQARIAFTKACPGAARWGRTNNEKHFGLSTLAASIDHVVPFRRGGTNEEVNLVTACGPCQFGRNQWTLEEVEIEDPRKHRPLVDDWDGLSRLIFVRAGLRS